MRVELTLDKAGLAKLERELVTGILTASTGAVHDATRRLEKEVEALYQSVVPGRAWRAWKSAVYPRGGGPAYDPVGEVFGNGAKRTKGMLEFWSLPGTVRAKSGRFLAVPLDAALGTSLGRHIGPQAWEARFGAQLRPLFRPGKVPLLVADGAIDSNGQFVAAEKADAKIRGGQRLQRMRTVAVFALLDTVPHANRASLGRIELRARAYMVESFNRRAARVVR